VFYAANKADSPTADADAFDLYRMGVQKVYPVSALHGRGMGDLEADVVDALPAGETPEEDEEKAPPRIALIGRPNAGKSSLLNRILGEERVLVDERPGTTRDSIDALVERGDKRYVFVDTAGIRRKAKVSKEDDAVESLSVAASIRTMERADVVVLLCDAEAGVAEQDAKILGLAEERGRAMIVVLTKSDLLSKTEASKAEELAREKLSFLPYAPVIRTSAKTGRGIGELFLAIDRVEEAFRKRVTTGELNRFFEQVIETRPPQTMGGKAPRLYYVTQTQVRPPTFVAMTSIPDAIHFSYRRFVVNRLREHFGFEGVPVRVHYRARRRAKRPRS
jgi:GTP-binding protein